MSRDICSHVYNNKNLLMLVTVCIYISALYGMFNGNIVLIAFLYTIFSILLCIKNYFPVKIFIIWALIFYLGVVNVSSRLKESDDLLDLAPVNSTIYGKIVSIPQQKDDKIQFFFDVNKIEYDGITKQVHDEKVLVSINSEEKFAIYDSYKIRGRLSMPFKAGNPSQFDYGNYLRNFGTYAVFYGKNPYSMHDLNIPCYEKLDINKTSFENILRHINNYREEILNVHSQYLKSPNLEILGGIVFGDDAVSPPKNIKQSFVNSGLLHILAASGMNVAFIYGFFFFILRILRVPFKINIGIGIFAVLTYVLMTGLGASVVRAALMLIFVLIGKLIDRDANSISLLSFVAFLMLIYNPMFINDVGFQLSFVVTFGLLLMTPYLLSNQHKIITWGITTVSIPIIAQLWVMPVQIFYFNNISLYSVFANIMSVSIVSVISCGGFISSLLYPLHPLSDLIFKVFDFVLNPLITLLVNISDFWGNLPNSTLQTTHPSILQIALYYLILINITFLFNKNYREKWSKLLLITLPTVILILIISTIPHPNKNLEITAFDVGNADAFMIKTPKNKYIMIDTGKSGYNGGKSQAEMLIIKYMKDRGIKTIDSIVVTHFDNDHCGGTVDLMKNLNVKTIYVNTLNHKSKSAKEIYNIAKLRAVNVIVAKNSQEVLNEDGLSITNYIVNDVAGIGDNESSIITLVKYNNFSMLFTGDAGIETFNKLKTFIPRNITVLKVGHHGASGVINKSMADYLMPKYSIISTGENKFGHPSIYTIETLRNSKIMRTDISNSIKIIVNKQKTKVLKYNSQKKKYE